MQVHGCLSVDFCILSWVFDSALMSKLQSDVLVAEGS